MVNTVVLHGTLSSDAQSQVLASESVLVRLELRTRLGEGPSESVPVVWFEPPSWATALESGAQLVVIGRVRRRFFSAGGRTQSRTEVVADRVVRASSRRRASQAMLDAVATLEAGAATLVG